MSHNARLLSDLLYANGTLLNANWWQGLDSAQFKSINGDQGGVWSPSAPIQIGGAGMTCAGAWASAGSLATPVASGVRVVLGDNDYVTLSNGHTGATRTLLTSCARFVDLSDGSARFVYDNGSDGAQNFLGGGTVTAADGRILVPLRVHHGATFSQITLYFTVSSHTLVPSVMPAVRVLALSKDGVLTSLKSGGFVSIPQPVSAVAWRNGGNVQSFTVTLDPNIVVNTASNDYFLEIVDEGGLGAQNFNLYISVLAVMTNIADQGPQ